MTLHRGVAALLALLAVGGCETWRYPERVDRSWIRAFSERLPATVASADAVVVGSMVCSLGEKGKAVTLFRMHEVLKGKELISRVMAPYPEAAGAVTVAYDRPPGAAGRPEPRGEVLIFMTAPRVVGKNMHLVGDRVGEGMIYALPSLVRETRALCRRGGSAERDQSAVSNVVP